MNRLVSVLICCLTFTLTGVGVAQADEPGDRAQIGSSFDEDSAELTGALTARKSSTAETAAPKAPRLIRTYVPACQGNLISARRNLGVMCDQARQVCDYTLVPDDIGYWVYTAPAGTTDWSSTGQVVCRGGVVEQGEPEPVVTAEDFRRLPIPAAGLEVQPGDRRTLVNVPTNLYARSQPTVLRTTILGFPIRVRATPSLFHWRYGDGNSLRTANAGGPYPRLDTAHTYLQSGRRTVTLATEYDGEYSVAGGPWQPIDGTATVASPSIALTVQEARTHLVS